MGQWISSREFAESSSIGIQGLLKAVKRAFDMNKKFCHIKGKILPFKYTEGIGRGGKILQIWNTPLSTKQVEALEKGYPAKYVLEEMGEVAQPSVMESMDSKILDCKGIDNEKTSQNIQGETLHARGCNNVNECASGATSSSDSALYRNDLPNGGVVESQIAQHSGLPLGYASCNDKGSGKLTQ